MMRSLNCEIFLRDLGSNCGYVGVFEMIEDISSDEAGLSDCAVAQKDDFFSYGHFTTPSSLVQYVSLTSIFRKS